MGGEKFARKLIEIENSHLKALSRDGTLENIWRVSLKNVWILFNFKNILASATWYTNAYDDVYAIVIDLLTMVAWASWILFKMVKIVLDKTTKKFD